MQGQVNSEFMTQLALGREGRGMCGGGDTRAGRGTASSTTTYFLIKDCEASMVQLYNLIRWAC